MSYQVLVNDMKKLSGAGRRELWEGTVLYRVVRKGL